jgi:hypothetical protein
VLAAELDDALGFGAALVVEELFGAAATLEFDDGDAAGVSTVVGVEVEFETGAANCPEVMSADWPSW